VLDKVAPEERAKRAVGALNSIRPTPGGDGRGSADRGEILVHLGCRATRPGGPNPTRLLPPTQSSLGRHHLSGDTRLSLSASPRPDTPDGAGLCPRAVCSVARRVHSPDGRSLVRAARHARGLPRDQSLRRSGHCVASDALLRTPTVRTIRVQGAKGSTAVGPFAETKEQLGGFSLIEAKDIDEACAIAARFPPARVAVIEIRPVQALKHSREQRRLPS
jgi:hypothetical protein